jgi:hypothetical protein
MDEGKHLEVGDILSRIQSHIDASEKDVKQIKHKRQRNPYDNLESMFQHLSIPE